MTIRLFVAIFLACFLAATPYQVGAHGGGLNRDGCHQETATGGYHCHPDKDDNTKTILYVAGGLLVVGLVFILLRRPMHQLERQSREKGFRFTAGRGDQVGAFLEWRF